MSPSRLKTVILTMLLGLSAALKHANAVCCTEKVHLAHECLEDSERYCASFVCFDGTISNEGFCGNGPCNIYGCDCDRGCRRSANGFDRNEAKTIFEEKHNVTSKFAS